MPSALLQALSLPECWRGRPCWRVLELGFGSGRHFLATWQAWRNDPQRARMLHYVAIDPQPSLPSPPVAPGAAAGPGSVASLSRQLAERCWGLTRGFHRFSFDDGQVLLTLCIGATDAMLREQRFEADSIWLGDDPATRAWLAQDAYAGKALARRCRRGTQLAGSLACWPQTEAALRGSGFVPVATTARAGHGVAQTRQLCCVSFDPAWTPRLRHDADAPPLPVWTAGGAAAVVIGAGLAGAAVAASLARRGLQVQVLDAQTAPALGTSGLPAGLLAPQLSADDNHRSRLSRAGLRATIELAQNRLAAGRDWQLSGVLERRPNPLRVRSGRWDAASSDWSRAASAAQKTAIGLDATTPAVWHPHAGWIRPAALVHALLDDRRIEFVAGPRCRRCARAAPGGRP